MVLRAAAGLRHYAVFSLPQVVYMVCGRVGGVTHKPMMQTDYGKRAGIVAADTVAAQLGASWGSTVHPAGTDAGTLGDIVAKLESLVAKLPHRGDARNPVQARFGERKFELVQAVAALRWVQNMDDIFVRIAVLHILLAVCTCVVLH